MTLSLSRIAEQSATSWNYHLGDALGSVRQITDLTSDVTMAKSYQPCGEVLTAAGEGTSNYGFAGESTSQGLIYLRARYYDPELGRFISKDSLPGISQIPNTYNRWMYAYGNPINRKDPSGLSPDLPGILEFMMCFDLHSLSRGVARTGSGQVYLVTAQEAVDRCKRAYSPSAWAGMRDQFGLDKDQDLPDTAFQLLGWFIFEHGEEHLVFDGDHQLTQELARSILIHNVRAEYYGKGNLPPNIGDEIPHYDFGFADQFLSLAFARTGDISGIPLPAFLGSFLYQVKSLGNGRIGFRIDNDTSLESGTHFAGRPPSGYSGSVEDLIAADPSVANQPLLQVLNGSAPILSILRPRGRGETSGSLGGGNFYQTFTWTEEELCVGEFIYSHNVVMSALNNIEPWPDYGQFTSDPDFLGR